MSEPRFDIPRHILNGDSADVYFRRTDEILKAKGLNPVVAMEIFPRDEGILGGCATGSTLVGSALHELAPSGTMPHALILIMGDTVEAARAFDEHIDHDVTRIVLIDTFRDEVEESLRVAEALGERLWGVRVDTPGERGGVTPELVIELRHKLDLAGHNHVRIFVSSGLT